MSIMQRNSTGLFFLLALLIVFFYDITFFGKTFSTSSLLPGATPGGPYGFTGHKPDIPFSFDTGGNAWVNEPNPYIIKRVMREGSLPVWSPYEGLGMPLIGNLNTEVFNPLKAFLNLLPNPVCQDIFFLLRLLVMGLFTYLFLREKGLSQLAALFGSSSFMLSGYSLWWVNLHPLSTIMYIPAVFYFYERWSSRKALINSFLMSLSLSFALVAGKIPDVIMGLCVLFLYALWKGATEGSMKGLLREGGKIIFVTVSGAFMAAIALLPFLELYGHASPLARAIRTGASSHTLPVITSVALFQPLFLGLKNYFYASWLSWTPQILLPHAATVILLLCVYAVINRSVAEKTLPFVLFSAALFCIVYGLFPAHLISKLPVFGSIEFLKYNGMFYFSLSVIASIALDDLLSERGSKKKFAISIVFFALVLLVFFFALYGKSPLQMKGAMTIILVLSLSALIIIGLVFHVSGRRQAFGLLVFLFLLLELFVYMPKDHPDRGDPYKKPPYLDVITSKSPYRIIGGGTSVPPLVSGVIGLYDMRAINVLLPGDYYMFFENLMSFSVPLTNYPSPLFSATSPFTDLVGVKYILSEEPLNLGRLGDEIRNHVTSLRWVRLFDAMIKNSVRGGATYGIFNPGSEARFSLFFPMKFLFETRLRVKEPFIFMGFSVKDASQNTKIRITVEDRITEVTAKAGEWEDKWLNVSDYMGHIITITIGATDGKGSTKGSIVLGNFGFSPGHEKEEALYEKLMALHQREIKPLEYKGAYAGIHVYENTNVMDRAFVVSDTKQAGNLDRVIEELQGGLNFRETGLVAEDYKPISPVGGGAESERSNVIINKYAPDEIVLDVNSGGGLLVVSDLYFPGWKAKVNGREERVVKAFGVLRGVAIGKGRSEVILSYRLVSLCIGGIITSGSFFVWLLFLYYQSKKNRGKIRSRGFQTFG